MFVNWSRCKARIVQTEVGEWLFVFPKLFDTETKSKTSKHLNYWFGAAVFQDKALAIPNTIFPFVSAACFLTVTWSLTRSSPPHPTSPSPFPPSISPSSSVCSCRPRARWHLWTAGSSWWRRSWTVLRRGWPPPCRNWRRLRRRPTRARGESRQHHMRDFTAKHASLSLLSP